jgi:hypothetical protein
LSATVHVFVFVSRTTKYSVEDLVSAAAVAPRTATPVAIRIAFLLFPPCSDLHRHPVNLRHVPRMTAVIPGTGDPGHMTDNAGAMRGPLPDPDQRRRMIELVEAL